MPDPASPVPLSHPLQLPARAPMRERALVLVVDDDESSRYVTCRLLRDAGLETVEAVNAAEALRRAADRPDTIVLDVGLPDMDGFSLCQELRALPSTASTPILYLSARYPGTENRVRGLDVGADAYLSQPVDPRELVATVHALLRSWWAGRATAESEALFRQVQEVSPDGFVLMQCVRDAAGAVCDFRLVYVNPAGERVLSLPAVELEGHSLRRGFPTQPGAELLQRATRVVETGEPEHLEVELGATGADRWYRVTMGRVRDGVAATFSDITPRRRAEAERERLLAELANERERLHGIFTEAPATIAVTHGAQHVIELVNPHFLHVTGHPDVLGRTVREAFPELAREGLLELLDRVYRTGVPFAGHEMLWSRDAGAGSPESQWHNFVLQPLFDAERRVTGILIFAVDVTAQVRARRAVEQKAAQLGQLTRALESSNRALDQFAYAISHDLKAPLRAVANYARYLEEELGDQLTGETRGYLDRLRDRVERLQRMIEGVLEFSRAGRERRTPERVEVEPMVQGILELLDPPLSLRVEVQPEVPVVLVERAPLEQVLRNLIDNAAKHGRSEEPRVRVTVRDAGTSYAFAVEDNGPGIPAEALDAVWALFRTLRDDAESDGTGIGLAVVKRIVESQGGRVWVEPAPGSGAVFRFLWPKHLASMEEGTPLESIR